jgi:hypothetical protein
MKIVVTEGRHIQEQKCVLADSDRSVRKKDMAKGQKGRTLRGLYKETANGARNKKHTKSKKKHGKE